MPGRRATTRANARDGSSFAAGGKSLPQLDDSGKRTALTFSDLGLHETILRAVASEGYTIPTPIQEKAIPLVLAGKDLFGCAQTGTGKTAAFALPILHRLWSNRPAPGAGRKIRVLVLSPTQIGRASCRERV